MGGVGGAHLLTLARLGVGAFNIADYDHFELANFNRQTGASINTIGRSKVQVMEQMAREINPELDIRVFPDGVVEQNVERFLEDVNVYVDGLDFFAFQARRYTFGACARLRVPAITAAPIGMGAAVMSFLPGRMTFEEYFRLEGLSEEDQAVRLLLGLSPAMLQRSYLVEPGAVDMAQRRVPSTGMACQISAGMAATETLKVLLRRGDVVAAPWGMQFDAFRGRLKRTWRPMGNRNPLQRVAIAIASRQLQAIRRRAAAVG